MTVDAPFYRVYRTARAGEGFPLWGPYHLSWLAGSALFLVLLLIVYRRSGTRANSTASRSTAWWRSAAPLRPAIPAPACAA